MSPYPNQARPATSLRGQSGRLIELQILIAVVLLAIAVFVPQVVGGEGFFMSLLVTAVWVTAIVGGFVALAFLGMIPEIVRDWRTTPVAVRAARKKNALGALRDIKPEQLNVRAVDRFGNTALHVVCDSYEEGRKHGAPEIVDFLLQHGADVNAVNTYDKTPLDLAIQHEYGIETARRLLAGGAKSNDALYSAAAKSGKDTVAVVKALLGAGASASVANVLGSTPLHQAASYGIPETIKELLTSGADINARDNTGKNPLHAALWMPSLNERRAAEIVSVLVAAGADREAADRQGRTPRALAAESGISAVIAAMNGAQAT